MRQQSIQRKSEDNPTEIRNSIDPSPYFIELAASLKNEGEGRSYLEAQLKKILPANKSSVLFTYLHDSELPEPITPDEKCIFPFGCNASQTKAVRKAMSERLSLIQGPPGTGKTQTILNIIANVILQEKTVAVVSNNNAATANVAEKLAKYGLEFLVAQLGNNNNKTAFFTSQPKLYPDFSTAAMDPGECQRLKGRVYEIGDRIEEYLELQNDRAKLKQELAEAKIQQKHFDEFVSHQSLPAAFIYPSFLCRPHFKGFKIVFKKLPAAIKLKAFLNDFRSVVVIRNSKVTFLLKLRYLLDFRLLFPFFRNASEDIVLIIEQLFYKQTIKELETSIAAITNQLNRVNFAEDLDKYTKDSMRVFKGFLALKYRQSNSGKKRKTFGKNDLWQSSFKEFQSEYPVILSTTHAIRANMPLNHLFDYVIIDEASQVDLLSGSVALSCARHAVVVGDLKQLPNIITTDMQKVSATAFARHKPPRYCDYTKHSILSSLLAKYNECPETLLREHYRCHPLIIGYCNSKFYNNELVVMTEGNDEDQALIVYKTPVGNHQRGTSNQREIDVIKNEVIPANIPLDANLTVGIISPYRAQTNMVAKHVHGYQVDTVHKFQGRERDIIILSTVANEKNDFVDNANLLNVAVSRAVKKLILVVSGNQSMLNSKIGDIIKYVDYNHCEVKESKVYSVFDLLYKVNKEELDTFLKGYKKRQGYLSETIYLSVIERVLMSPIFIDLDVATQVPLNHLIRDLTSMSLDELRFVKHPCTSTDFVIFSKVTKAAVLVVEVDGHAYHAGNSEQLERDAIKDTVLGKCEIPILRAATTGSQEVEKLTKKLAEILNRQPFSPLKSHNVNSHN